MQNPFDPNYLGAASPTFGPFAWLFFGLQLAAALWGLYILYVRTDNNGVRRALWRQLGIALVIAGGIGLLLGALRLANVPILNQRYWFYIQLLVELALAGYVFYFARTTYPRLIAESQSRGRGATVRRGAPAPARPGAGASSRPAAAPRPTPSQPSAGGPTVPTIGRPASTSGRREARRDRKRRSR